MVVKIARDVVRVGAKKLQNSADSRARAARLGVASQGIAVWFGARDDLAHASDSMTMIITFSRLSALSLSGVEERRRLSRFRSAGGTRNQAAMPG